MGLNSFKHFFEHLDTLVLKERQSLQEIVEIIHPQISAGLFKLHEMKKELEILKEHTNEIKRNKNFRYKVNEIKLIYEPIPENWFATNCTQYNTTCHKKSRFENDEHKKVLRSDEPGIWPMHGLYAAL